MELETPPAAVAVLGLSGLLVLVGWTAAAEDIGRRAFGVSGREGTRATHLASGWLIFAFASVFPFLGWFVIFPYVTLSGVGSIFVSLLAGKSGASHTEPSGIQNRMESPKL